MGRLQQPKLEEYKNAFVQFMECYPEEVRAKPFAGACIVEYKDEYYKVYHVSDMIEFSEGFFEGPEGVMEIPQEIWIEVAEEVHVEPAFYDSLLRTIANEQLQQLNLALNICHMCGKSPDAFWESLYNIDDYSLYTPAVIAASEVLGKGDLENDILTLMIADGDEHFNEIVDGIFEAVEIKDGRIIDESNDIDEGELFYIFSTTKDYWEYAEQ